MVHDSQIFKAKENLKLSHGGHSQKQASDTNPLMKGLSQGRHRVCGLTLRRTIKAIYIYIYTEGYSESTEPIDAVNILPLARFEPTTSATPPSTTPDTDATNCATETSPKKDVQEALILTTTDAVHVVYWFFFNGYIYIY